MARHQQERRVGDHLVDRGLVGKATLDAALYLFFFFPGIIFFFFAGYEQARHSWSIGETSEASAWRPIIYPFKTVMPVTAALLLLQGVSEFIKSAYAARTGRWVL